MRASLGIINVKYSNHHNMDDFDYLCNFFSLQSHDLNFCILIKFV